MTPAADWRARWVWTAGEASPRNAWRCFRRPFELPAGGWDAARIAVTADSRYLLYVNGELAGRGPDRSWPSELAYDVLEVGHLLRPGERNVVAALVMHYGVSTFNYRLGRGGLLAQLELLSGDRVVEVVGTDAGWRAAEHAGHDPRSGRMSVQLGFAERVDARSWDDAWIEPSFDDGWAPAVELGPAGIEPWTSLVQSEVPPLTEEPVSPASVVSLATARPPALTAVVDVVAQMMPDSRGHANAMEYVGLVATVLRLARPSRVRLGFPLATTSVFGPLAVGGEPVNPAGFAGTDPERAVELDLAAGDHLLALDVTGSDRGGVGLHLALNVDGPLELVSPDPAGETAFVTVGPFDAAVYLDHEAFRGVDRDHEGRARALGARTAAELMGMGDWVRPVPPALVSRDDVFAACAGPVERRAVPVPLVLQNAAIPNAVPAVVPLFEDGDTELVLDFGRELSGYLEFDVEAPAGTVLDLYGFEFLHEGSRQDTHNLDNTLRYTCRAGRQSYSSVVRRGLRYLMLVVRPARDGRAARGPVRVFRVRLVRSTYPVADVGEFRCSDARLDQVWQAARRTLRLCMEDTYVDCPAYEQTYWVGDARNAALVNSYVFGADALTRRSLGLVPGSRVQTPLLADQVPSGWDSVIPNWTFFWVIGCLEHHERTGDREFAAGIWPLARDTLAAYLEHVDARGLLAIHAWNLLDWAPMDQPNDGIVAHQTMFLARALDAAAALAAIAGEPGDAGFREAARGIRDAVNAHLWAPERGAYRDCIHRDGTPSGVFSVQTQVVALLCGLPDAARSASLERHLLEPPADFVRVGSPFMSFFLYEALERLGHHERLVEDIRTNYGRMIEHGATTCWEMYPGRENRANAALLTRSHCHAWSAAPGYFLGAVVLGVRSDAPGWTRVVVEPRPCGLSWARGRVPLPAGGWVEVNWTLDAGRLDLRVIAPPDLELDARLPDGQAGTVEVVRL